VNTGNVMDDSEPIIDQELLDYELGRLGDAQRAMVEQALEASLELRQQQVVLRETFAGLDAWTEPAAPEYLVGQVLAGVASAEQRSMFAGDTILADTPASALPPVTERGGSGSGPILTIRELVAIAACITIFVGVFVPAGIKAKNMAWRAQCQSNLEAVAAGLASYSEDFQRQMPFAGSLAGASWRRSQPGVTRTSNTQHPFLLVKFRYVRNPDVFVCPTREHARPMVADDYNQFDDVAEKANFAYAYQNMGGVERPKWGADPKMVMMADASPLTGTSGPHNLSGYPDTANSRNHDREDGQNVLRSSGFVGWETSPKVGVADDNIWTPAREVTPEQFGYAVPVHAADSFLVNSE